MATCDSSSTGPLLAKRRYSSVDGVKSLNDRLHDRYSPFKRKSLKRCTEELLTVLTTNEYIIVTVRVVDWNLIMATQKCYSCYETFTVPPVSVI
ncbi:unnamed protein product [Nippostrongylus brasiliensis]|uniref:BHLH domain-containing protein n=1 Tax=Nippostrongylus brasiliensis TaxID=27835 RepID=A0A0N4YFP8_NIPBR|nr:unnamed protein product [Nippostrongylus brasiliensis]